MISKDAKITVVGAGAIGGITAAFIKKAGWDPLLVCKHQETADLSTAPGIHITGIKGDHTISLKAVNNISDLSGHQDLILLATKAYDCLEAAKALLPSRSHGRGRSHADTRGTRRWWKTGLL